MLNQDISECLAEKLGEKFNYAQNLLVNKSKYDPPDDPYKSKYEAKAILLSIEALLLDQTKPFENKIQVENKLAIVYCLLGSIHFDIEEPNQGNEYVAKAVEILVKDPVNPECIICYVSSLNLLGFSACKYDKQDEAIEYLDNAVSAYKLYKDQIDSDPKEFGVIFGCPAEDEVDGLEKAYTATLFYLAQVYSAKGDRLKSAKYCHSTLRRQLDIKGFDAIDWALNSATLSQYLIEKNGFKEARNHLAAAQIVLEKEFEVVNSKVDGDEVKALKECLQHRLADIFRCWGKYGIYLMNSSKERLLTSEGDTLDPIPQAPDEIKNLIFSGYEDEKIKEYECAITNDFLLTYDDAKPVFRVTLEWLNKAKEYYTLEDHASDYVSIIQDCSQLYHLLAFYQPDESVQCKFHKRRLDMLDSTVKELNPSFYLNICRELWYELGETCLLLADLKRFKGENSSDQHFFLKAQQVYIQGIKYFETYIDSFKIKNKNGTIEKYPEGFEKSILMACMFLGRMYSKLVSQEKSELLRSQKSSLHWYRTVLEYCNLHKEVSASIPEELAVCREMANLIPVKLSKIEQFL